MDEIESDPRFSHIRTDPRFKPMPKSKRKVKIDSRFQSLFTNRHFSHKTDTDKRGRPIIDSTKKNKNAMERFYELSSDSESDSSSDESIEESNEEKKEGRKTKMRGSFSKNLSSENANLSSESKSKEEQTDSRFGTQIQSSKKRKMDSQEKKTKKKNATSQNLQKRMKVKGNGDDDYDRDEEDEVSDIPEQADSSDEESEEELPEFTNDFELEETEVDHKWNELQQDAQDVTESTHRLAVCNMDWDFVKAQDLFVLFKSFVPSGGSINSVAIYPSEFGKERMAEEALLGPKEMRSKKNVAVDSSDGKDSKRKKDQKKAKETEKSKEEHRQEKLREYQLNRLKYYYAVVDCDSVPTADKVYTECDGREYEMSSVRLDLRFIPEDMTFEDEPREVFAEGQSVVDYQPTSFSSTALSQAKVEVTWDETEFDRLSRKVALLQQKELESIVEENKYADIIAPPESDSDMEDDGRPEWLKVILEDNEGEEKKEITEEDKIQMYRKVLMDKVTEEEEDKKKEEEDFDMELEVQPGLKLSVEKKLKKKAKKKEDTTVVSEYLEKKKQKKKKKKAEKLQAKMGENTEQAFSDDDIPEDVDMAEFQDMIKGENMEKPSSLKKKKKRKQTMNNESEIDEHERAELELMLMGDGSKSVSKPEVVSASKKSKKSKKKMALLKRKAEQEKEDFVLDVEDSRFGALYTSHHFHIDPSAPQFKKTKNMLRLVDEQIKQKQKNKTRGKSSKKNLDRAEEADDGMIHEASSSKSVSKSLIESLKRKMKKTSNS